MGCSALLEPGRADLATPSPRPSELAKIWRGEIPSWMRSDLGLMRPPQTSISFSQGRRKPHQSILSLIISNLFGGGFIDTNAVPALSENVGSQSLHPHLRRLLSCLFFLSDPSRGRGLPIRKTSCVWVRGGRGREAIAKQRFNAATRDPVVWQRHHKAKASGKKLGQQHFCKSFYKNVKTLTSY